MPRIRTIKPDFFTSADIVALSPLARLYYIALWCEADRNGRLIWKPKTFKFRYFPADNCDIDGLSRELIDAKLIATYIVDGEEYAEIPQFSKHQRVNNREAESSIPASPLCNYKATQSGVTEVAGNGAGERKGKERKGSNTRTRSRATALPDGFSISERVRLWAEEKKQTRLPERLEHFVSYVKRNGKRYVDWDEALMGAIREDWAKLNGNGGATPPVGNVV